MNAAYADKVYKVLKEYLPQYSKYDPRITQKALKESDKFPLVAISRSDDSLNRITTDYRESENKVYIQINIYAQDVTVGNKVISNVNVCNELSGLVDRILTRKFGLRRISCTPTPNLDDTIYRITMRFTAEYLER